MNLIVSNEKKLKLAKKILNKKSVIAVDTETNSLLARAANSDFKVVSVILADGDNSFYFPFNHVFYDNNLEKELFLKYFKSLLEKLDIQLIAHDYKFDRHVLNRLGIFPKTKKFFDTLIAARMVNENESNKLEDCLERYLGVTGLTTYDEVVDTVSTEKKKQVGLAGNNKATFDLVEIDEAANYGVEDTEYLIPLKNILKEKLKKEGQDLLYYKYMIPQFNEKLYNMEVRGVKIDKKSMNQMGKEMKQDLVQLRTEMIGLIREEVNFDSPKQLSEVLYNEYTSDSPCDICDDNFESCEEKCESRKLWEQYGHKKPNIHLRKISFNFPVPERTETGQPSSGKTSLKRFQHYTPKNEREKQGLKFIKNLLKYKKISKLKSTFVDGLRETIYDDGKVHSAFNQLGARSGRLSSSDINVQNLPSQDDDDKYKIRSIFIPQFQEYKMIAFDYSNLEMRILAHFSKDPRLLEMFKHNHDAHGATAVNMFDLDCHPDNAKEKYPTERAMGKTLNFSLMYGMSANSLYYTLKDIGIELEDKELQQQYGAYSGKDLAKVIYDRYFDTYKGVKEYIENQKERGKKYKEVYTIIGRKKRLPEIDSEDSAKRGYYERLAVNSPIQGAASDIIMCAQIKLEDNQFLQENGVRLLMQVHDEILFECPEENIEKVIPVIKQEMETPFDGKIKMNVKLEVDYDIGRSYHEAK